jgi:murein hydrolase activator
MNKPVVLVAVLLLMASGAHGQTVADQAAAAAAALQSAISNLQSAERSRDRVAALTDTIRAYEQGLAALREALRLAQDRESRLTLALDAKRADIAQLLAVLSRIDTETGPMLMLHPDGPLDAVRSGMILADVTPALQAQADALRGQLQELADLRGLQAQANETLINGLGAAQTARTALTQAISERTGLPRRFTQDPDALRNLIESADTMEALAAGLVTPQTGDAASPDFAATKGKIALPVLGRIIRRAGEADPSGVRRPGIAIATRPQALVTSPAAATIRYRGPLLDYGNVMILEPGLGYLLVVAGCQTLYGDVGEVIAAGAPLGLMGGGLAETGTEALQLADGTGQRETETLYLELRLGAKPVDPAEWFAVTTPPFPPTGD